jgi:hypothetical protein
MVGEKDIHQGELLVVLPFALLNFLLQALHGGLIPS